MFLQHLLEPTTVSKQSALPSDSYINADPRWLRLNLQYDVAALPAKASSQVKRRRAPYKQHSDVQVRVEPELLSKQ